MSEAWKSAKAAKDYEEWLANARRDLRPRTVDDYSRTIRELLETYPDKETRKFTTPDLQGLVDRSPGSSEPRKAALRSFFRPLYLAERIPEYPVERVRVAKSAKKSQPEVLTDSEVEKLYALDAPDGQLIALMIECRLKKRECRELRWRYIDLERGYLDAPRRASLTTRAKRAVRELDEALSLLPRDHLWGTNPGGGSIIRREDPISNTAFQSWWRKCLRRAGVRECPPGTTVHTYDQRSRLRGTRGAPRLPESADRELLERLERVSPQLAASYGQVHVDLADEDRLSYLGLAGEIRGVMRGAIALLAPDDDVRAQDWYVGHEGRPTHAERVTYIVKSGTASADTTDRAELAEDKTAKLVRALYVRASRAFHAGTQRSEVVKIVKNVEAVLIEILPE